MRPTAVLVSAAAVLALAGCVSIPPSSVEPGTGPASSDSSAPMEGPPSASAGQGRTANFRQKYTYEDGVAVEVIRVKHTQLTGAGVGDKGQKAGDPIQVLSVRVTNGSKATIDVSAASGTLTYGPDGVEASTVFDQGIDGMQGKVLPGKARTGTYGFVVPKKYQRDVQLEFTFDYDHDSVVFSGSIA